MVDTIEAQIGELMRARAWTLAVAESCTGGLVGHRLTQIAGASEYFLGGVISYSDRIKIELLGVAKATIVSDGAVSEDTARQMALGARARFGASFGLAITGIAGPGGGSASKPVGLTWIAVATPVGEQVERHHFDGNRSEIKQQAADQALQMLMEAARAAEA